MRHSTSIGNKLVSFAWHPSFNDTHPFVTSL